MQKLYVVNKERRNTPRELSEKDKRGDKTSDNIERINKSISVECIKIIQDTKIKEQEKLWEQLNVKDEKKHSLTKLAYGIFSIFLSTLIAIVSFTEKKDFLLSKEFIALSIIIIFGMALINFSIIMHIISLKQARLLLIRQINCLRYAIESCNYAIMTGSFPIGTQELRNNNSIFYHTIGKHRKLPINNHDFREFHKKTFESADDYSIWVITLLTVCLAFLPLIYLWNSQLYADREIVGAISGIAAVIFITAVIFIMKKADSMTNYALNFEKNEDIKE
ncbi:MAG: hypothetical protein LZF61_10190 [Nitrosomonas sp.]|nr:MAG: hypothetical protein LZF61_10190 [Nitrosomonas sp.]